jgi:hypothetical protein
VCAHELASPDFFTCADEIEEDSHNAGIPVKNCTDKNLKMAAFKMPHSNCDVRTTSGSPTIV